MLFSTFSEYLSRIEKTASRNEMVVILAELFQKCSSDEIDKCVYLATGKVTPQYEPEKFSLADKTIIKAISYAFNKTGEQITKIFNEKGDLGEVITELRITNYELRKLSICDVYDKLYELTQISGAGTIDNKIRIISSLLKNLDALSGKYIVRMILDKLRLGFSDATILEAYSWMLRGDKSLKKEIEKKYNIHPDLGLIGKLLKEKNIAGLNKIQIEPGDPILMAKCERAGSGVEILEHGEKFGVEDKYDGFRLQIHILKSENPKILKSKNELFEDKKSNEKEIVMFSRNLENVTKMYPDVARNVLEMFKNTDSLIIEGEAVGINPKTGEFLNFQETVQRKRKYDIEKTAVSIPLRLIIFDVLYLNGKELIRETFEERRKILESIVGVDLRVDPHADRPACPPAAIAAGNCRRGGLSLQKNIILSKVDWCQNPQEIENKFKEATKKNMEGVVAKKADGIYQAGARDWNWIKFKRGFQGQKLTDTIDCVVMGYDFGQGKRINFGVGSFLIGVLNTNTNKYETVSKVGGGLTEKELVFIKIQLDKIKVTTIPKDYVVKKEVKCDIWVEPKIVFEILADEITKSQMHTAGNGLALRFPRLVKFRPDKSACDITTVKELEKMYKKQCK